MGQRACRHLLIAALSVAGCGGLEEEEELSERLLEVQPEEDAPSEVALEGGSPEEGSSGVFLEQGAEDQGAEDQGAEEPGAEDAIALLEEPQLDPDCDHWIDDAPTEEEPALAEAADDLELGAPPPEDAAEPSAQEAEPEEEFGRLEAPEEPEAVPEAAAPEPEAPSDQAPTQWI